MMSEINLLDYLPQPGRRYCYVGMSQGAPYRSFVEYEWVDSVLISKAFTDERLDLVQYVAIDGNEARAVKNVFYDPSGASFEFSTDDIIIPGTKSLPMSTHTLRQHGKDLIVKKNSKNSSCTTYTYRHNLWLVEIHVEAAEFQDSFNLKLSYDELEEPS